MPQDDYYFFFSYASENHKNATKWDEPGNYLDNFFDRLCKRVSDKTARKADEVAYRDRERIRIGDFWDKRLIEGLQKSRVVVAVLSPHYLKSENCGKELAFFQWRWDEFVRTAEAPNTFAHRILPLYWEDSSRCTTHSPEIMRFFKKLQYTQVDMPGNYPAKGLSQLCCLEREKRTVESLCEVLAERIVELAEHPQALPLLPNPEDYINIESLYSRLTTGAQKPKVASGPSVANVMFVVGTQNEMKAENIADQANYSSCREDWQPFRDAPGATVGLLTREGANKAGVTKLHNLEPTDDLVPLIKEAEKQNSPVLLVLDRETLRLPTIALKLGDYDHVNFPHCGLVTAGGGQTSDEEMAKVFKFKAIPMYPNHIWTIPTDRKVYVDSVASVLGNLRKCLLQTAKPVTTVTRSNVPTL
jgi:hypothetical protein